MQSEQDWMDQEEGTREAYRYFMRTDPDMREFLGPIETKFDELTGREIRQRWAKIGMIRGASPDSMIERTVYLDPFPHIRQDKGKDLQGWYSSKGDGLLQGQRDRPCETDAILTQPYGGFCAVGCTFCYVNSGARGYRGSGLISVPVGYGEHVRKQLKSLQVSAAGYFSSFTDPFLPLESLYHNTQEGATAFVNAGLPIFFLSRLEYPGWAFDLLRRNKFSYAQKSINTPSEDVWRRISPGAMPLSDHFDQIRELRKAGIYVSIQCNPVIPGVTNHHNIEELFYFLGEAGANHVIVKFVEAGFAWAKTLVSRIKEKFPDHRGDTFERLFTENQAGGNRTIIESYRREAHERYQRLATKYGMTYALCYEFTHRDGRWKTMGPEFLTADQCHGHRVPMHRRLSDEEYKRSWDAASELLGRPAPNPGFMFVPMDVCPPSGCLRCDDEHAGEPLCGSETLRSAKALRLPDLRNPFGKGGGGVIPLKPV